MFPDFPIGLSNADNDETCFDASACSINLSNFTYFAFKSRPTSNV